MLSKQEAESGDYLASAASSYRPSFHPLIQQRPTYLGSVLSLVLHEVMDHQVTKSSIRDEKSGQQHDRSRRAPRFELAVRFGGRGEARSTQRVQLIGMQTRVSCNGMGHRRQ